MKNNEFITQFPQNIYGRKHYNKIKDKTFVSKSISKSSNFSEKKEEDKESGRYSNKINKAEERIINHLKNSLER